jgi:hypothetical protein
MADVSRLGGTSYQQPVEGTATEKGQAPQEAPPKGDVSGGVGSATKEHAQASSNLGKLAQSGAAQTAKAGREVKVDIGTPTTFPIKEETFGRGENAVKVEGYWGDKGSAPRNGYRLLPGATKGDQQFFVDKNEFSKAFLAKQGLTPR